jgi:hypothetical protein
MLDVLGQCEASTHNLENVVHDTNKSSHNLAIVCFWEHVGRFYELDPTSRLNKLRELK